MSAAATAPRPIVLAQAFPNAHIHGFDFHEPSITTARERAEEAGVSSQTTFEVADAKGYSGSYDLICFFDCLHDMGDPVGIAEYARGRLADGGTVLLVEPFALDDRHSNLTENPMAPLLYTASSCICTPNSLSQEVGLGLGAQAGEGAAARRVRAGRVHPLPAGGRDAAQPHPRGSRLIEPSNGGGAGERQGPPRRGDRTGSAQLLRRLLMV